MKDLPPDAQTTATTGIEKIFTENEIANMAILLWSMNPDVCQTKIPYWIARRVYRFLALATEDVIPKATDGELNPVPFRAWAAAWIDNQGRLPIGFKIEPSFRSGTPRTTRSSSIMVSEYRVNLAPYVGHRVEVRGLLTIIKNDHKGSRGCIKEPEVDGEVVASHIWCMPITQDWPDLEGEMVTFSAIVRPYKNAGGRNYCLSNPLDLKTINPPALKIPQPVIPVVLPDKKEQETPVESPTRLALASIPAPTSSPEDFFAGLRSAKQFAVACGGAGAALRIIECLPPLPPERLKAYLTFLEAEFGETLGLLDNKKE
jgi:hypothetical protein